MTGLFAKLVDAATGHSDALRAPSRARFAQEGGFEPQGGRGRIEDITEVAQQERNDVAEDLLRHASTTAGVPAAKEASKTPPRTASSAASTSLGIDVFEASTRHTSAAASTASKESLPHRGQRRADASSSLLPEMRHNPAFESVDKRQAPPTAANDLKPSADPSLRARVAETSRSPAHSRTDSGDQPLLDPLPIEVETSRPAPAADVPSRRTAVSPSPEIRIGRIEVNPPAASTVTKATPRTHLPARAAPRQSLDDYLTTRRR